MKGNNTSTTGFGLKPKALMCYICGREFGTSSLEIHMKQCEKKNGKNGKLTIPKNYDEIFDKIKSGEKLSEVDYSGFNNKANDDFKEKTLTPCPNCGRKFFDDRLEIHLRSCKGPGVSNKQVGFASPQMLKSKSPGKSSNSTKLLEEKLNKQFGLTGGPSSFNSGKGSLSKGKTGSNGLSLPKINPLSKSMNCSPMKPKGPVFLVCYVCGREFGKTSLEIHLEQCMEKHYKEELSKGVPKKKIKTPNPPDELLIILDKVHAKEEVPYEDILQYNGIAKSMYTDIMMKTCEKCGRKFNGDRLDVHLKSCNPSQLESNTTRMPGVRPRLQMCPLCGREFGSLSLAIHMKTCRDRFDREQLILPRNQRRNADDLINKYKAMEVSVKGSGDYNMDRINDGAYEVFTKDALVACDLCGRTFLPDRLKVHQRSCKGPTKKK